MFGGGEMVYNQLVIKIKKSLFICVAALMVLAVSCKKDDKTDKGKYGVDGVTPMPEAVDLGLASGVKWASFNIGASKEYEYGDYYAWGETIPFYSSLVPLQWRKRNETDENELRYDWASSLYTDEPNRAYSLDISSSDKVRWSWVNVARHHGYPVRPVCVE